MSHIEVNSKDNSKTLPKAFMLGRTPEAWCEELLQLRGIKMSARKIRELARESGHYISTGRNMLLLPEHVDQLLSHWSDVQHTSAKRSHASTKGYRSASSKDDAIRKLKSISSKN